MGFFVKFWGTRGSIPTPGWQTRKYGGNTACVEVCVDDTRFVCDGGTGLRELGVALQASSDGPIKAHLLFSHPHWDHIQGFPFFVPAYAPNNTLYIYGAGDEQNRYFELLSGQMQSDYFPVSFSDLKSEILPRSLGPDGSEVGGVKVRWLAQRHPGGSLAFRFEREDCVVVYATDNEIDLELQNPAEAASDPAAPRQAPQAYLDFVQGADLLIADAQYTDEEYVTRQGWGHPRATTVVDAAVQAGVKSLALYHHDPMHDDDMIDALVDHCQRRARAQQSQLVVFGARESVELRIDLPTRGAADEAEDD